MKKILRFFIILSCVFSFINLDAQDARFSQYYAAPLHNNPALSGIFPGQFRIMANYRNQWSALLGKSAFNTYGASFDIRIPTTKYDYFSAGINFLRDDAGDARFNQTKAYLNLSYLKQLSGGRYSKSSHYLSLGFQAGIGQHGLDWSKLSFSNQFDDDLEQYVATDPTGENFGLNSKMYVDFNAGLAWYAVFEDNLSVYAGFSMLHIIEPDVSFYDDSSEPLYRRYIGQAGGQIPFNNNLSILPSLIFTLQGPSFETTPGFNMRYSNNDFNEIALRAGAFVRIVNDSHSAMVTESLIISAMLEIEKILIGLSYDVNVSSVRNANNSRGAFELSLQYIHPEKRRFKVACPKF